MKTRKEIGKLQPEVITNWLEYDSEDSASWSKAHLNQEILDYLVEPFISGFTYCDPKETSSFLVLRMLAHFIANSTILSLRDGLEILPQTLSKNVDVIYNANIEKVLESDEQIQIVLNDQIIDSKKVIYALPAFAAQKLVPKSIERKWQGLLATQYASTIHISFEASSALDSIKSSVYGMMISKKESQLINVVSIENNKHLHELDKKKLVINVMLTSMGAKSVEGKSQEDIEKTIHAELLELFPELKQGLRVLSFKYWQAAIPMMKKEHIRMIKNYRDELSCEDSHFLIGDYLGTPCVEGAVESAVYVANLFEQKN